MLIQFFLNVALKGLTQFGALVDGLEVVGRVVTRYGWIEKIYLRGGSPLQKDLEECILKLYTACLRYFDKAYTEFVAKRFKRIVNSLKPRASTDELLEKIEDAENEVQRVFTLVEAEGRRIDSMVVCFAHIFKTLDRSSNLLLVLWLDQIQLLQAQINKISE